jgi:hypothetical protein
MWNFVLSWLAKPLLYATFSTFFSYIMANRLSGEGMHTNVAPIDWVK